MKSTLPNIRKLFPFYLLPLFAFAMVSCIKDEAPNAEADILECTVPDPDNKIGGEKIVELNPGNKTITVYVPDASTVGVLAPEFVLTPGATIDPASGTSRDFSTPQIYTVTSQDGKWKKEYTVSFTDFALKQKSFSFENFKLNVDGSGEKIYQIFYEKEDIDGVRTEEYIWGSGNPGFAVALPSTATENYPTFSYEYGVSGRGVRLVTRSTGKWGEWSKKPIAAGNLFLGDFDISKALTETLKSTRFGIPAKIGVPDSLKFWYKYKPGTTFTDKDGNTVDMADKPSMYAVLYEPALDGNGNPIPLNGDNVLDVVNQNIIFLAKFDENNTVISDDIETAAYTHVSIPFKQQQGRMIDYSKLNAGKYNLAIVFSSSIRGAYFEGAIGSTLCIDEVELISH